MYKKNFLKFSLAITLLFAAGILLLYTIVYNDKEATGDNLSEKINNIQGR
jgi:hypothetical protein